MKSMIVEPATRPLQGEIEIPGDKSISHRAIIFASLSEGKTRIHHLLEAEDVLCTIDCFRSMGVSIQKLEGKEGRGEWVVEGVGLKGLKKPPKVLWCGNSGTAMRLLMGILAAQDFESVLTGDASLNKRPMKRVMEPLTQMGAIFSQEGEGTEKRKIHVRGGKLRGINYKSPVASAQVKSAILLAGLWAEGETSVEEPTLSRDHTERMLEGCGLGLTRQVPPQTLKFPVSNFYVPGDISSAAFFMVAASLVSGSDIKLKNVGVNQTRTGILDVLRRMGAEIAFSHSEEVVGEPVASLHIRFPKQPLGPFNIRGDLVPRLIDEIPILGVAASCAKGDSEVSDAKELRVKESDRIQVLAHLLTQIGVKVKEMPEGLQIEGQQNRVFKSASVQSYGDHRMAMSMAVAALLAEAPLEIQDIDCVNTSFPSFWQSFRSLGAQCRNS